jgi:hypothetical protein
MYSLLRRKPPKPEQTDDGADEPQVVANATPT